MRIPHYLIRTASGLYTFRLRVPLGLRPLLGRQVIKRALRTADTRQATIDALDLASRYARLFMEIERQSMRKKLTPEDVQRSVAEHGMRPYELDLSTGRLKVDGPEDHALAMDALSKIGAVSFLPRQDPILPSPVPTVAEELTMSRARDAWLKSITPSTIKKTLTIKASAIDGLVRFIGAKRKLYTLTRVDLAKWYQHLRDEQIATPTLTNKQSYIGGRNGFFAWAMASGYYPQGSNPAAGHIAYSANEKRKRNKFGFKAFTVEQIQTLYHPANFAKLSFHARWACLLGLYTGARVSEIGQLRLLDVMHIDGIPCLNLTDDGDHQSLKTGASARVVPIHPHLIELGLLDHVESLIKANESELFPKGKQDAINGRGNWITKAFGNYLKKVAADWPPAKRGFHSLRKTVIQEMQGKGVASEMRAQIVGHELDDEHHAVYSRQFTPREKLHGVKSMEFSSPGLAAVTYKLSLAEISQEARKN